ncbi:MAG TPA: capsule biosynthesis protein, partial [Caulobacteraceae bacterium]
MAAAGPRRNYLTSRNLFFVIVLLPTALASLYYAFIAAPIYVSEARFVVRSPTQAQPMGIGSILQGAGLGGFSSGD